MPTGIRTSLLRSGVAHWDQELAVEPGVSHWDRELAVEVWQCPLDLELADGRQREVFHPPSVPPAQPW